MSRCVSNIDALIVPGLEKVPGTVSARLAAWRDARVEQAADESEVARLTPFARPTEISITAIDIENPCAEYSEVTFKVGERTVVARLIMPRGICRPTVNVPCCLMFHDIDRPVRGWHHMTRFAASGFAVLALDDEPVSADDLVDGISSPAFAERVQVGLTLAEVARSLDGVDPDGIFAWGEGLGGGIALAVAALDAPGLVCCALDNPLPAGVGALAPRVRGDVLLGTSLMDDISDPHDQIALFNGLACDRRHIIYAKYAHERINAFENEVLDFFNQTFYPCPKA